MKQRLVDANELKEEFKLREDGHYYSSEQYLDYVLNEWKTRPVEHGGYDPVSVVNEAPTVDAIPVEWLKKKYEEADDMGMGIEDWSIKDCFGEVLAQWEKENESETN